MTEITGIDHIYLAVSDLDRSQLFYDTVMPLLGFRSNRFDIDGDPHLHYYNRHFGLVLRPARTATPHDPYAPGLHHLCLCVASIEELVEVVDRLRAAGVAASPARHCPEYAPDYWATFFDDPDGIRLEVTNYREERRRRHDEW